MYTLILLTVMHILLDGRYRIVSLFPTRVAGFVAIASAYLAISLLLLSSLPRFLNRRFCLFDIWVRQRLSPLLKGGPRRNILIAGTLVIFMIAAGCYLRWLFIKSIPIAPIYADMLPLIQEVCETLIAGNNPYTRSYFMPWEIPLTYWPGLWMPYLITHVLGVDPRWIHLGVVVIISLLFAGFLWKAIANKEYPDSTVGIAVLNSIFLFAFSSEFIIFANIGHTPPYWLWLSLLATTVLVKKPMLSAVFLGLVLSSRQPALIYAPIMAIYWLRRSVSVRKTAYLLVVAAVTYLIICGPFILLDPDAFFLKPLRQYAHAADYYFTTAQQSLLKDTIGFSYLIRVMNNQWLLQATNALAMVITWTMAWKRLFTETDVLLYLSVTGIVFTLTSPIPFHYEYMPLLIVMSFASIAAAIEENKIQMA
jgi:hypothetical protein